MAAAILVLPVSPGGVRGSIPKKTYIYEVNHPLHGKIGTYTNTIEQEGADVSVQNRVRVLVKVLSVVAYDQSRDSKEVWRDGRLVSFESLNLENGKESTVTGRADGEKFVVDTPKGRVEAPANVFPNNPWSMNILKTDILLGTETGNLYKVRATAGEDRTLKLGNQLVKTRYFKVDGDAKYELWFDERGIPVRFTEIGKDGTITFTLMDGSVNPAQPITPANLEKPTGPESPNESNDPAQLEKPADDAAKRNAGNS